MIKTGEAEMNKGQGNTRDNGLASFEVKNHPYGLLFWASQSFESCWPSQLKGAMSLGNQGPQSCLAGGINVDHDRIVMVRDELGLGEEITDCVWTRENRVDLLGRQMTTKSGQLRRSYLIG